MYIMVIEIAVTLTLIVTVLALLSTEGRRSMAATALFSGIILIPFYPLAGAGAILVGGLMFLPDVLAEI